MPLRSVPAPLGLLAELTHRCPLKCPYCSNPLALTRREDELDIATWTRVFDEAAALGIVQVHLSGGEPAARSDLQDIVRTTSGAGLYTNLITSGIGLTEKRLAGLIDAGLDHLQLSVQDSLPESADVIAGYRGGFARKKAMAEEAVRLGVRLTVNVVIHRANIGRLSELVTMAIAWGAQRVEIAHAQYYGWALANRAALLPTRAQVLAARDEVETLRREHHGRIVIDAVTADYHASLPKPCAGGWGRRIVNVTPSGRALPCHAAETLPRLSFWNVRERSLADIWYLSPAFNTFRGDDWMREPCRSCARKAIDFGGCRCQAFLLTGDARNADPVCRHSPHHSALSAITGGALTDTQPLPRTSD